MKTDPASKLARRKGVNFQPPLSAMQSKDSREIQMACSTASEHRRSPTAAYVCRFRRSLTVLLQHMLHAQDTLDGSRYQGFWQRG
jgi:hypothetical protein